MAILRKTKTFEELKKKVKEQSQGNSFVNKDEIKWEPNKTYRFRLLFREQDENSKFHWHEDLNTNDGFIKRKWHGAKDANDKYVQVTCPQTFLGLKGWDVCPVCKDRKEIFASSKSLYDNVKVKDGIYAYVYVVSDPVNPSNNGHVKIMWMGKKMYTDLKLKIWGVDERYVPEGEELEEVDTNEAYGHEAFLIEDGFDLIVKTTVNKTKDPTSGQMKEYKEYNCSFYKDRTTLDVDLDQLEEEMEALKLGADFVPEDPDKLVDFHNRCVLHKDKSSLKSKTPKSNKPETGDEEDSMDDDLTDGLIDEIEQLEAGNNDEDEAKPKTTKKVEPKSPKRGKTAAKKVEEKVEDLDELDGLDSDDLDMGNTEDEDESDDIEDIDIDELMADMPFDDEE